MTQSVITLRGPTASGKTHLTIDLSKKLKFGGEGEIPEVDEIKFDRLGVFTYSEEEGTLAEELDDNIPSKIKEERKSIIMDLQANISAEKNEQMVGKTYKVLVDKSGDTVSVGRTEYDSPEIDNIVHIKSPMKKGEFVNVKIESSNEFELIGTPV